MSEQPIPATSESTPAVAVPVETLPVETLPVEAVPAAATGNPAAQEIAAGYKLDGVALELGTVVVDGQVDPTAQVRIPLAMMNRHGLIAGATGTGKTRTLQVVAEQLSTAGVPVVMADVKGDLSGLSQLGVTNERIQTRSVDTGSTWTAASYPTEFVSLGTGGLGIPVRATITSFGPILLSKVLQLNATQESTLGLIFHWAEQQGLALIDLKDLRSVIAHLTSDEGKADIKSIGGVSSATAGVILRALTNLEADGGDTFFGQPEISVSDLIRLAPDGRGIITLFELGDQAARPALFSTFLMWILSQLFQQLPEAGDIDKPKLVFIFDESHLLFHDSSKAFVEQVVQTVKLIRSKGVGVFFCSQLPTDIPNEVLSQLGARIQHALRAFTPDDQAALSKTVKTYPKSKAYDIESALTSLATGEAIVTVLSEKGAPTPVAWTRLRPPTASMEAIGPEQVKAAATQSPLMSKYGQTVDQESAFEKLAARAAAVPAEAPAPTPAAKQEKPAKPEPGVVQEILGSTAGKSFMRSLGRSLANAITKSIFKR